MLRERTSTAPVEDAAATVPPGTVASVAADTAATTPDTAADPSALPARRRSLIHRSPLQRLLHLHRWFRAFRRTRPFWGGLWLVLGGWRILSFSLTPLHFVTFAGFNAVSGYVVGGGMMLCGLICWALPSQRFTFGAIGLLLAIVSLVASNLGGFLVGMLLGVVGGAMTLGWGVKKPRRRDRRRAARLAEPAA